MIDYNIINKSIQFYENAGFPRIETPWIVPEYIDSITRPDDVRPYVIKDLNKNLVASGEQSFLSLYLRDYLPKGRFQTVTPCFRDDKLDFTHTKSFIKNELIITDKVNSDNLEHIVNTAKKFFETIFSDSITVSKTFEGFDLEYKGVELGSYGIRECEFLTWIYGTGCAEPRTSKLLRK